MTEHNAIESCAFCRRSTCTKGCKDYQTQFALQRTTNRRTEELLKAYDALWATAKWPSPVAGHVMVDMHAWDRLAKVRRKMETGEQT